MNATSLVLGTLKTFFKITKSSPVAFTQPSIPTDGVLSFQGNLLTKAAQIRSQQSNDGWEPGALVSSFHHRAARPIVSACPADRIRD